MIDYQVLPDAAPHTCWEMPGWEGLMSDNCRGCDQAALFPCTFCGYGHVFTSHNEEAHRENGDIFTPRNPSEAWHDSPHVIRHEGPLIYSE